MKLSLALVPVAVLPVVAGAQLIRPTSATATSQFSGLYDIGNTIDGSGLPANFTLSDGHANYTTNNHWTTALNQTVGMSATFSFATPQTLTRFYMWNHRSNGIASNSSYAVTRFDLILRDAGGSTLLALTDLTAVGGTAFAQTFCFPQTAGVSSAQFIVRATQNNNVSPYTGLAEVAFGFVNPCSSADVSGVNQSTCVDGALTADDIIVFLGWYFGNDARANIAGGNQATTPDDTLTADDIIVFLGRFFAGC